MSDFEFELGNTDASRHGIGKFILKGNKFITFLLVTPVIDSKTDLSVKEHFFNSIKID